MTTAAIGDMVEPAATEPSRTAWLTRMAAWIKKHPWLTALAVLAL